MRHIESLGASGASGTSGSIRKQLKLMVRRKNDEQDIKNIILMLANDTKLPLNNCDHALTGNFIGFRDCHIKPDWLLKYKKLESEVGLGILRLEATGTHADLF